MTSFFPSRIRCGALLLLITCAACVHAETTRADLLKMPGAVPFTKSVIKQWQPLVTQFGGKVFSDWERGLYEGAIGNSEQSRQWLLKAANKGGTLSAVNQFDGLMITLCDGR